MDVISLLTIVLTSTVKFMSSISPYTGVVIGLAGINTWHAAAEERTLSLQVWGWVLCGALIAGPGAYFGLPLIVKFFGFEGGYFPRWHLAAYFCGCLAGLGGAFLWARRVAPMLASAKSKVTRRSDLVRNRKTDVREIHNHLPDPRGDFDPRKYMAVKKGVFLGLDENEKPQYLPLERWLETHIQLVGTSGAGKGVAASVLLVQALRDGEAVVVMDPKDDEWAPHVLRAEAERLGVPFRLVDLRKDIPQLNLFDGADADELEELLVAGFSLAERGEAADFYRIADRQAARLAGCLLDDLGPCVTPQSLANHPEMRKAKQSAVGFVGKLDELARVGAFDAPSARYLTDTIRDGGCLYIIGSMRNERIKSAQRMVLVRMMQLVELRDRIHTKPRPVRVFLDEFKHHLSRTALTGLGAARDKGMYIILAHQSLADFMDCPADLDGDAIKGAVVENCSVRIIYKVRDPDTANWLASMSGDILVDDEVRTVGRNVALAEVMDGERTVRQAERYMVDKNMLMNLPYRVAAVYGGALPVFAQICPVKVQKKALAFSSVERGQSEMEPAFGELAPLSDEADCPDGVTVSAPQKPKSKQNPNQLQDLPNVDF